ncbi:MAG: DUF1501 domain-containing protein [Chloroflexi bacterium]|nr:DUF1501 domain-containing protein [Chloroflexota bacterium]
MINTKISRRDLLKGTGILAMGALPWPQWMPRVALAPRDAPTQGDTLVCIFMRGGADGLNLVVPHGDKDYYAHRNALAIAQPKSGNADAVVDLDGFFGLHPNLKPFKDIFDAHALAIVHAAGSPDPSHSHFDAMDYMERGTPGDKAIPTGWIGRHLQAVATENQSPFRAVGMGTLLQASLRGPVSATALQSIADFHLRGDQRQVGKMQTGLAALYAGDGFIETEGQQTLQAMRDLAKIAANNYTPANGAQYPDTPFGKSLATIAQLIKSGLGVEVACADIGGWDTHVAQGTLSDGQMPALISEFANGLSAFYADMQDQMNRITLVTMSEFGRRVQENSGKGTDHGHGNVMFLMGGNILGGKVYGDWPGLANANLYGPGDLAITTDFRDVLGEIVKNRLGNSNLAAVFPSYTKFNFHNITKTGVNFAPSISGSTPIKIPKLGTAGVR